MYDTYGGLTNYQELLLVRMTVRVPDRFLTLVDNLAKTS